MNTRPSVLEKAFDIIDSVASLGSGATLAELVAQSGLPKTTVHRLVLIMESRGYLAWDEHGYVLGLKLAGLGLLALDRMNLRENARKYMRTLALATGESVHLCVKDNLEAVCIERVEGTNSVRLFMQLGRRAPLYRGSSAKILLAYSDPSEIEAVLQSCPASEERDDLRKRLFDAKRDGYVVTHGDLDQYAVGIAAPIVDHTGKVVAAVSMAGLESRIGNSRLQQNIAEVCACAVEISKSLGAPPAAIHRQ